MKTELIDQRTRFGKDIVSKVKAMQNERSVAFAASEDMHPGLVSLRIKDLDLLLFEFNRN